MILIETGKPLVLCAVDWIDNGGNDEWQRGLEEAAGTTMDRVALYTLLQHDGVHCDPMAVEVLAKYVLDQYKLSYRSPGLDFRLTGVNPVKALMASQSLWGGYSSRGATMSFQRA